MIWIISESLVESDEELIHRKCFIEQISCVKATPWIECQANCDEFSSFAFKYYKCKSERDEHGLLITAHMNMEVQPILKQELSSKRAIVVINSCRLDGNTARTCCSIIKDKNKKSEIWFAKQEYLSQIQYNYIDNVGEFGFATTLSERELFQNRKKGLVKAIRASFNKIG